MSVKLLTKHYLEFLSLKGGCTGSSESIHFKMPHCWNSHALAHLKAVKGYTKISGKSAVTNIGVELHLLFTVYIDNLAACYMTMFFAHL